VEGIVLKRLASPYRPGERSRYWRKSPCFDIKLPAKPEGKVEPLLRREVESLLAALPPRYLALAVVGVGAGLRQGGGVRLDRPDPGGVQLMSLGSGAQHSEQRPVMRAASRSAPLRAPGVTSQGGRRLSLRFAGWGAGILSADGCDGGGVLLHDPHCFLQDPPDLALGDDDRT
jgi:hypothetical protein